MEAPAQAPEPGTTGTSFLPVKWPQCHRATCVPEREVAGMAGIPWLTPLRRILQAGSRTYKRGIGRGRHLGCAGRDDDPERVSSAFRSSGSMRTGAAFGVPRNSLRSEPSPSATATSCHATRATDASLRSRRSTKAGGISPADEIGQSASFQHRFQSPKVGWVGRTARCPQFAGPFPYGPPPNRTCQFPGIRLSSELRRECICDWWPFGMDVVVAGRADH